MDEVLKRLVGLSLVAGHALQEGVDVGDVGPHRVLLVGGAQALR